MLPVDQMQLWQKEVQHRFILNLIAPLRGAKGSQQEEGGWGCWIPGSQKLLPGKERPIQNLKRKPQRWEALRNPEDLPRNSIHHLPGPESCNSGTNKNCGIIPLLPLFSPDLDPESNQQ